jgi:purine-nucleoside phosphorylase
MSEAYDLELIKSAEEVAHKNKIKVHKGVYVAFPGPNLETKAEYKFLRAIGADVVGMSTIPEDIVANHMGMSVLGISIITDECFQETLKKVNVEEIISAAMAAEPKMTLIMKEVIKKI